MSNYFVMLEHPSPNVPAMALSDDNGDVIFYDTKADARDSAKSSWLGDEFGYEIFSLGEGES